MSGNAAIRSLSFEQRGGIKMCAILGWQNLKENLNEKQDTFKEMLETMSCRGKDNTGYHFEQNIMLGHKRLAIVDLHTGNQPMYYKDYVITYNGEMYNTEELKQKLIEKGYTFETTSDTEVIIKGYAEYKEKVLSEMEGIFAFGIYNKKTKELFLARDRFGIKPLYYCQKGENLIFASMIRAILKSKIIKPYLSKKALGEILAMRAIKKTRKRNIHRDTRTKTSPLYESKRPEKSKQ